MSNLDRIEVKVNVPMTSIPVPMSLRTAQGEIAYQIAKHDGKSLRKLSDEPAIQTWEHWRLIGNRFPYGVAYREHHMLVPKREVADMVDLTEAEMMEFYNIIADFVTPNYDLWFVNTHKRRSILAHFHVHCASYFEDRGQMRL